MCRVGTAMTLNGLQIPCYCQTCQGQPRDYRTVEKHKARAIAERPLFPAALDSSSGAKGDPIENDLHEQHQQDQLPAVVEHQGQAPVPHADMRVEDFVSHVEALPNCNEQVFLTVFLLCVDCVCE